MCEKCSLLNPWTLLEGGRISLHQTVFQPTPWTVVSSIYWSSTSLLTHICKMTQRSNQHFCRRQSLTAMHNNNTPICECQRNACWCAAAKLPLMASPMQQSRLDHWSESQYQQDCCWLLQFLCSIVAARWTHDCFFFFFFCYSDFSGPPSPPTLWFTNSEAEAMCNQTLFLGVMHAPFLIQKSNLTFWK